MKEPRIPVAGPWITDKEVAYVSDAVSTNWYGNANEYISRFEEAFAQATGRRYAVSLPSCTSGLHLALAAAGVGEGDEVIVPDLTWIASSAPVSYVGAEPVFVDVDPVTWCLSTQAVEAALTERTKAIIAVDLYGSMPDFAALRDVAERRGVLLIEDAAESIGSTFDGRPAGSFGDVSVFSFHGSKTLTTGEGGMLVADNGDLMERVLRLRDHGRAPGDRFFFNTEVAFKYKMSSMQAALGLAQLERLDELVDRKREIFGWYAARLQHAVELNWEPPRTRSSYWMTTAIVTEEAGLSSQELMEALDVHGIDTRPLFHPLSSLPAYAELSGSGRARSANAVSSGLSSRGINLPSALSLTEADVDRVAKALLGIVGSRHV